jgi:hypothetical protein
MFACSLVFSVAVFACPRAAMSVYSFARVWMVVVVMYMCCYAHVLLIVMCLKL